MIIFFKPLLLVMILLINSCFDNDPSANFIVDNEVVLTINDEKITSKQFKKMLVQQKKYLKYKIFKN